MMPPLFGKREIVFKYRNKIGMPLLEQDLIYHLEILCLTPVLMGFLLLKI
jgi:hypothetical protein